MTVTLKTAYLAEVRRGAQRFYSAVHSEAGLSGDVEFNTITALPSFNGNPARGAGNLITRNRPVLGPIPYDGGGLSLEIGLFSLPAENLAEPYLKLLELLSASTSVAFRHIAAPYTEPLRAGVKMLVESERNAPPELKVGLAETRSRAQECQVIAAAIPRAQYPVDYRVSPQDGVLIGPDGRAVTDSSYLIIEIAAATHRPDWKMIDGIREAWNALADARRRGDRSRRRHAFEDLRAVVQERATATSADLTVAQAREIVREAEEIDDFFGEPNPAVEGDRQEVGFPTFDEFDPYDESPKPWRRRT